MIEYYANADTGEANLKMNGELPEIAAAVATLIFCVHNGFKDEEVKKMYREYITHCINTGEAFYGIRDKNED